MGNGEWGMGNGEKMLFLIPHSPLPTPDSRLPTPHSRFPTPLLPPAPAQCLIELNQGEQFVASRLRQVQLGGEQVAVGVQCIELRIHAALISQIGEARPVL